MNRNTLNAIVGVLILILILLTAYLTFQSTTGVESSILPFG